MWIFDRSRTTYSESVDKFMNAVKYEKADQVFSEIARQFDVSIEAAKNTYATPMFHLGVGYKVSIAKYLFGRTEAAPRNLDLPDTEYRYTETALLFATGGITKETFLLMNIIRFQVLNPTLESNRFNERLENRVLPLLLTLQTLRHLEKHNPDEAYISETELGWLYQKIDHENIDELINQILDHRKNGTPAPPNNNADAFFNLFDSTGVIVKRNRVFINGERRKTIVISANRSMVVDNILADPPEFFPITWEDRWKWAHFYSSLPPRIERFVHPEEPFVIKVKLPEIATYEASTKTLTAPAVFSSKLKDGDLVAWEKPVRGLKKNVVYQIVGEPNFLVDGNAVLKVVEAYRSLDPNICIAEQF